MPILVLKVKSINHLKSLCLKGKREFCITLKGGLLSRKIVDYDDGFFFIENLIDGSAEELQESEIAELTNIPEAIKKGAFFCED